MEYTSLNCHNVYKYSAQITKKIITNKGRWDGETERVTAKLMQFSGDGLYNNCIYNIKYKNILYQYLLVRKKKIIKVAKDNWVLKNWNKLSLTNWLQIPYD